MTVYFIGAGPGNPDLITVAGLKIIKECKVCLYAGSLIEKSLIAKAPSDALVLDTSTMDLKQIIEHIKIANTKGLSIARLHSGDPCLYGAVAEQIRWLDKLKISYEIIPGVSAYCAMAAAMKTQLTLPELSQSIILTRTSVKSSPMPKTEQLNQLAKSKALIVIHLSINNLKNVVRDLTPIYGDDCPAIVGYRISWRDEKIIYATLSTIRDKVKQANITRTALIMVGHVLEKQTFKDSKLYDPTHSHIFREKKKDIHI